MDKTAPPTLYVVATPIGNLDDVTQRALSVLASVDTVVCEDTRVTRRLLERHNIRTPLTSMNARTEHARIDSVIASLREGNTVALVTDAGTPAISDPGTALVAAVRERLPDVPVVPIPGPSAVTAALSASGFPSSEFIFLGFLPHKKGRETLFTEIAGASRTVVFYESPHRICKTLLRLAELLSAERRVCIARELTKVFEQTVLGTATEVLQYFTEHPEKVRGEFVVVVSGF